MADFVDTDTMTILTSRSDPDYPPPRYLPRAAAVAVEGTVDPKFWVVDGAAIREMTTPEKDALVEQWRRERKAELFAAVNAYGESHYDNATEQRIKTERIEARLDGLTNRQAYLDQAVNWYRTLVLDYATRNAALNAAATFAEVMAVSLDFSNHDASDPDVSVLAAMAIPD